MFNRAITLGEEIRVNSAILLSIAKPNKTPKLENIRLICIVLILRKILSNITFNRIRKAARVHWPYSTTFIKGRSTAEILWTYRFNMATVYKTEKNLTVTGIDIPAAFDAIDKPLFLDIFKKFLPLDDITLINYLLSNTSLTIKMDNNTTPFNTTVGDT